MLEAWSSGRASTNWCRTLLLSDSRGGFPILVVVPFYQGDKDQAIRLANWLRELGGVSTHDCLLVHDAGTTTDGVIEPLREAFNNVTMLKVCGAPKADWSAGSGDARAVNEMWIQTATWIDMKLKVPWLWNEVDCCPTRSTFADELQEEYAKAVQDKKAFVGARVIPSDGNERMSGIAVYPPSVCKYSTKALLADRHPWDIVGAEDFRKHVRYTNLIHHFLRSSKEAPTFPDIASLSAIPKEAALFHPNKDGTLIERLRERKNGGVEGTKERETAAVSTLEYIDRLKNGFSPTVSIPHSEPITEDDKTKEANAIAFLAERSKRTGLDKGRITKRLKDAGFELSAVKPKKRRMKMKRACA